MGMTIQHIDDPAFLRRVSRLAGWPSRYLDGGGIAVTASADPRADLEVHITNGICSMLTIEWARQRATVRPGSPLLRPDHLWGLDHTLTLRVGRLLRRHGLIDRDGRATRRHTA
jgi:hypothetical protein